MTAGRPAVTEDATLMDVGRAGRVNRRALIASAALGAGVVALTGGARGGAAGDLSGTPGEPRGSGGGGRLRHD